MRRIIQRVVTVVTTTTWKISWEIDPPLAQPSADSVSDEFLSPEIFSEMTQSDAIDFETKEDDSPDTSTARNPMADDLPNDPHSYP
jgi:hypothetical protein